MAMQFPEPSLPGCNNVQYQEQSEIIQRLRKAGLVCEMGAGTFFVHAQDALSKRDGHRFIVEQGLLTPKEMGLLRTLDAVVELGGFATCTPRVLRSYPESAQQALIQQAENARARPEAVSSDRIAQATRQPALSFDQHLGQELTATLARKHWKPLHLAEAMNRLRAARDFAPITGENLHAWRADEGEPSSHQVGAVVRTLTHYQPVEDKAASETGVPPRAKWARKRAAPHTAGQKLDAMVHKTRWRDMDALANVINFTQHAEGTGLPEKPFTAADIEAMQAGTFPLTDDVAGLMMQALNAERSIVRGMHQRLYPQTRDPLLTDLDAMRKEARGMLRNFQSIEHLARELRAETKLDANQLLIPLYALLGNSTCRLQALDDDERYGILREALPAHVKPGKETAFTGLLDRILASAHFQHRLSLQNDNSTAPAYRR